MTSLNILDFEKGRTTGLVGHLAETVTCRTNDLSYSKVMRVANEHVATSNCHETITAW